MAHPRRFEPMTSAFGEQIPYDKILLILINFCIYKKSAQLVTEKVTIYNSFINDDLKTVSSVSIARKAKNK